jgi:hypothetical protein
MHAVLLDTSSGTDLSGLISAIVSLAIALFYLIAGWRIFTKAGKPGWAIIIPIYSTIVLLQIVGRSGWGILLFLIPIVNIIYAFIVFNDLSKSFGKGIGTTLGLFFLSPIFFPILGYGGAKYVGPAAAKMPVAAMR